MNAKHTPGPWRVGKLVPAMIFDSHYGDTVATVATFAAPESVIAANARLVAAAPELLEALKVLRERHQIDDPHHAHLCEFCKQADAAIAKAEGDAQ